METRPEVINETFDPIHYGFEFTADWYTFDSLAAHKAARSARINRAKELRKAGYNVMVSKDSKQLRTMGGIGSGHPQIEEVVSIYRLTATLKNVLRKPVAVGTRVYFYNGWMWSHGVIEETITITEDIRHRYSAAFEIGETSYIIRSEFDSHRYYSIRRSDFS